MHKSAGSPAHECGILWSVASLPRNEISLGGFVPVNRVLRACHRVISEYASLVRKSYSEVSEPAITLVLVKKSN